jgi:hypothetical protein
MPELEPTPEQLSSSPGTPLTALSWADVRTRVAKAGDFLLATTDPDGRPHVVPVLGVWLEGTVCFATSARPQDRNLPRTTAARSPCQVMMSTWFSRAGAAWVPAGVAH